MKKTLFPIALIILVTSFAILYTHKEQIPFVPAVVAGEPTFCDDYAYVCCGYEVMSEATKLYPNPAAGQFCHGAAEKCVIEFQDQMPTYFGDIYHQSIPYDISVGYKGCEWSPGFFGIGTGWKCSDYGKIIQGDNIAPGSKLTIYPSSPNGDMIALYPFKRTDYEVYVDVILKTYFKKLYSCGTSPCPSDPELGFIGNPVSDSIGCSFPKEWDYWDEKGNLITKEPELNPTVPLGKCYLVRTGRHICGYTQEMCSSDAECAKGHTYLYNGKGAECVVGGDGGFTIMVYGCKNYSNIDWFEIGQAKFVQKNESGSRCEVVEMIPSSCCPGSCGAGMRCDLKQRRCVPVETAQCRYDWECEGEREWCVHDPDTGKFLLRRNVCLPEGKCGVKEREVECCYDTDCPKGYFCDLDHTCKERIAEMKECPWECCVNEPGYFDKPCPEGEICYADHTCHPPGAGIKACNYNGICEPERGEDKENCPADCKVPPIPPPPAKDNMLLITVILMLGMFFLFGGMMVLMGRKKSGKKWIRRRY